MPLQWQPIETAPKDGTEVLLFYPEYTQPVKTGRWEHVRHFANGKLKWESRKWTSDFDEVTPSYWMPLPPPPEDADA